MSGAIYVEESGNTKINGSRKVDATYASIKASCPRTCPFMGEGCYAQMGFMALHTNRLDREADGMSSVQIARIEAKAIDNAYNGGRVPADRDLRIHVAGDARTVTAAKVISRAVSRWQARGGNLAWSYTHSWKDVPRSAWGTVSCLASVESVRDAKLAMRQGYAPAIVVPEHLSDKAYYLPGSNIKWVPCPQQTRGIGCSDCRLCFNADGLHERKTGIAFAAHGAGTKKIKRKLTIVQ